jgi:hypothetical protein
VDTGGACGEQLFERVITGGVMGIVYEAKALSAFDSPVLILQRVKSGADAGRMPRQGKR